MKVYHRVHNIPQPVFIYRHINHVQVNETISSKPPFILFLHPHLSIPRVHLTSGFTTNTLYAAPLFPYQQYHTQNQPDEIHEETPTYYFPAMGRDVKPRPTE